MYNVSSYRTAPMTPAIATNTKAFEQGRVVVNAQVDKYEIYSREQYDKKPNLRNRYKRMYQQSSGDHDLHVFPGDLCVKNRVKNYTSKVAAFSSCNGMIVDVANDTVYNALTTDQEKHEYMRTKKLKDLQFAGVAFTESKYSKDISKSDHGLVLQLGGINTIINTGREDITAGDDIVFDLPISEYADGYSTKVHNIHGIPFGKMLIETNVLDPDKIPHMRNVIRSLRIETVDQLEEAPVELRGLNDLEQLSNMVRDFVLTCAGTGWHMLNNYARFANAQITAVGDFAENPPAAAGTAEEQRDLANLTAGGAAALPEYLAEDANRLTNDDNRQAVLNSIGMGDTPDVNYKGYITLPFAGGLTRDFYIEKLILASVLNPDIIDILENATTPNSLLFNAGQNRRQRNKQLDAITKLVQAFQHQWKETSHRCIGRALSSAPRGKPFDILLNNRV